MDHASFFSEATLIEIGVYNKPNNSSVKNGSLKIHAPLISLRRDAGRLFSQATTKYITAIFYVQQTTPTNM